MPGWKTADGDTLLQLVCQSKAIISQISSILLGNWLKDPTAILDIMKIVTPDCKTANGITLFQLICRYKLKEFQLSPLLVTKWLIDSATIHDLLEILSPGGDHLVRIICQSEKCLIRLSSSDFLKLLMKNPLKFVKMSIPDGRTSDGATLLHLVLQSEMYVSHISSKVLSKWLSDSREITVEHIKPVHPKWKTLDGCCFFYVLCQSKLEEENLVELSQHYVQAYGLNTEILDNDENTALHIACQANKLAVVSYLVDKAHCNPNIKKQTRKVSN